LEEDPPVLVSSSVAVALVRFRFFVFLSPLNESGFTIVNEFRYDNLVVI